MFQYIGEWDLLLRTQYNFEALKFPKDTFCLSKKMVQIIYWPT